MTMNNPSLAQLMHYTYVRSDMVYRISLLNEFFDFVFFTDHDSVANKDIIERFAGNRKEPQKDIDFLKSLPKTFMEMFTRDSFRTVLRDVSDELQQLPTLSLTVAVTFSSEHLEAIGKWARETITPDIMLDISVDETVYIGCRLVWKNIMHDFSIEHYFDMHKDDLYTLLSSPIPISTHA